MQVAQLPLDLIVEIFAWLPVKSLLRFKCLSKSFYALISSFGFINSHFIRSSQSFNYRKMIFLDGLNKKFHVCDVNVNLKKQILPLGKPVSSWLLQVDGYCKGLILLNRNTSYREPRLALWNPSTRRCKTLPDCPRLVPDNARLRCIIGSGLGYDESIDEFKAFFIVKVDSAFQFWVYGLKSNIWKILNFPYLISSYYVGIAQFADGSVHWRCELSINNRSEIAAFDVSKEIFSLVPQPIKLTAGFWGIHVLGGSLCISYTYNSRAELYVKNKNGSWTQIYTVSEWLFSKFWFGSAVKVFGYIEGGKKILLGFGLAEFRLVSYDLKAKSFEMIRIEKNAKYWIFSILCCESLATVDM